MTMLTSVKWLEHPWKFTDKHFSKASNNSILLTVVAERLCFDERHQTEMSSGLDGTPERLLSVTPCDTILSHINILSHII